MTDAPIAPFSWTPKGVCSESLGDLRQSIQTRAAVGWVDVETGDDTHTTPAALEALGLAALTSERSGHVLSRPSPGERPIVDDPPLRAVTALFTEATEDPSGLPDFRSSPVRVVVGEMWVLTLRWPAADGNHVPRERFMSSLGIMESEGPPKAEDLGSRILLGLVEHLRDATRDVSRRIAEQSPKKTSDLRAVGDRVDRLELTVTALGKPGWTSHHIWFEPQTDEGVGPRIAEVLEDTATRLGGMAIDLRRRRDESRADQEQRRSQLLQLVLGTIAAVLLGPSLVAGIFDAFPGWLPVSRRGDALLGLSIASAGIIWLLVYVVPIFVAATERRFGVALGATVAAGLIATCAGLVITLPLPAGQDEQPPQLSLSCPRTVERGSEANALVAASDAEGHLVKDPSGRRRLDTTSIGHQTLVIRAVDSFGRATSQACGYEVVREKGGKKRSD